MIDIHSHVLPAVDDGARDLDEAVAMCRLAAADGCAVIVATPHQRHPIWPNDDLAALRATRDALAAALGDAIEVRLGAEIRVDSELLAELDGFPDSGCLALGDGGGGRALLLELERASPAPAAAVLDLCHELLVAGWQPILAHPEMIHWLAADAALVTALVDQGTWLQVTAMSLTGDFGRLPHQLAHRLVGAGLVQVVASDCHGTQRRPPGLARAHRVLAELYGEDLAHALTTANPARALGLDVPAAPAVAAS